MKKHKKYYISNKTGLLITKLSDNVLKLNGDKRYSPLYKNGYNQAVVDTFNFCKKHDKIIEESLIKNKIGDYKKYL